MNIVVFGRGFLAEEFLLASDRTAERVCLGPVWVCFSFFLSSPLPLCAPARERPTAGPSRVRSQSAGAGGCARARGAGARWPPSPSRAARSACPLPALVFENCR